MFIHSVDIYSTVGFVAEVPLSRGGGRRWRVARFVLSRCACIGAKTPREGPAVEATRSMGELEAPKGPGIRALRVRQNSDFLNRRTSIACHLNGAARSYQDDDR